jgi:hypothetical protein
MLIDIYNLEPAISTLVYVTASFGFVIATPVAGVVMKKKLMTRRGLVYLGYNLIATGMVMRTGDFGDSPKLWMSVVG